jgi:O-antigen/teichoic acid export membrane protein
MSSAIEELEAEITPLPSPKWHGRVNLKFVYALLDQGIVSFGNMVVSAAVSRYCAQGDFGIFLLALRSLDVINQVCGVCIWGPYTFNLQSMEGERRRLYLGSALAHQTIASVVGLVWLLLLGFLTSRGGGGEYAQVFVPLALPSVAIIFREFTRRIYFAEFRFAQALVLDAATVGLQIAGILAMLHRGSLRPATALWALSLSASVVCVYWFVTEWKHLAFSLRDIRSDFTLNMQLGKWFFGSNMLFLGSMQLSPWLLSATSGAASVAALGVCDQVVNIPRVALTSMQNAMAPSMARAFAEGGKAALRKVVRRMDLIIVGGSAVCAVGIVVCGPWVSKAIFHKTPTNTKTIFILLALNLLAYAASLAQSYALSAINRAELNFYAGVFGIVVQLVAAFALVNSYKIPGVVFALLLGNSVVLAARIFYYVREMRRP